MLFRSFVPVYSSVCIADTLKSLRNDGDWGATQFGWTSRLLAGGAALTGGATFSCARLPGTGQGRQNIKCTCKPFC